MGGKESKSTAPEDVRINHPMFLNSQRFTKNDKQVIQTLLITEQSKYDQWKKKLETSKPYDEYLWLPIDHQYKGKGLCGSMGNLKLEFQNYAILLLDEIEELQSKKSIFHEADLWYLLFSLAAAKRDIKQANNTNLGDVRPQNVFINAQGKIKIASLLSWPNEQTNIQKFQAGTITYVAPEDLPLAGKDNYDQNFPGEMFSIGLTVLSAGLTQDFSEAYDAKKVRFDSEGVKSALNHWKKQKAYSEILRATVLNLCQFQQEKRLSFEELWSCITKHEQKIKNRLIFVIDNAPNKLHMQVGKLREDLKQLGNKDYSQMVPNSRNTYSDNQPKQFQSNGSTK